MGTLYYGDNLDLDPPFNSAQSYNAFFHEKDGTDAASEIRAFEDTWRLNVGSDYHDQPPRWWVGDLETSC